jgi:hypothetical protein
MRLIAICAAFAMLAGCAARQPHPGAAEARYPLYCENKPECDLLWQRAQIWVSQNSGYRIQTATDAVIQTFGPFGSKVELAFQVLRNPRADGGAAITIRGYCDNMFGCQPNEIDAILRFKSFVRNGA